jgi:peptide/nickel transport system substrate-binding protein
VIDDHTFRIVTKYPDGILLRRLAQFGYIVPPHYLRMVGDEEFEEHPIGTGPFKFVKWTKGRELVLAKNEHYWRQGLPRIDRIVFKFANARERADMLVNGQLDLITNFEPIDLPRILKKGLKVVKEPSFTTMSINFNLAKKDTPFRDKRLRTALNHAVDVDELIHKVRLGNGIRRATLGMPGEFGYNPYIKPYPYDLGRARELLAEAGYGDGFKATLMIDDIDGGSDSALGAELKRQLAKVGIRLEVQGGNGALRIVNPKFDPSVPKFDLDMLARTCPDPLGHVVFIEGMVWYASSSPWSLLSCPALDQLYWSIVKTINLTDQARLCHSLERMIHEEAFSVFAYQEIKLYAMTKDVDYDPYITGMMNLREASIARRQDIVGE